MGWVEKWATSMVDVPGQIACVVYLRGCSIRCEDCHNCALQSPGGTAYTAQGLAAELNKRQLPGWICFQGGEPTDQAAFLESVVDQLDQRLRVALYTGRSYKAAQRRCPDLVNHHRVCMLKAGPFIKPKRVQGRFLATSNQELFVRTKGDWMRLDWLALSSEALASAVAAGCTAAKG